MDDKKKPYMEGLDEDVTKLDFQNVISEMTNLESAREAASILSKIHEMVMDTHSKNQKLSEIVQQLNSKIIGNATRVSNLLKMSEQDHKSIEQYKEEFESAWKIVSATQMKEAKAKETCEYLKEQVNKLTTMVHEQCVSENNAEGLKLDISTFNEESVSRLEDIDSLQQEIARVRKLCETNTSNSQEFQEKMESLQSAIESQEKDIAGLISSQSKVKEMIAQAKEENQGLTNKSEQLSTQICRMKRRMWSVRQEEHQQHQIEADYAKEAETALRAVKDIMYKRDRIVTKNDEMQLKSAQKEIQIERSTYELECLEGQRRALEGVMAGHEREMSELQKKSDRIHAEIMKCQTERRELNKDLVKHMHAHTVSVSMNHASVRDNDYRSKDLELQNAKVNEARTELAHARGITKLTNDAIKVTRGDLQVTNISAANIEHEMQAYQTKTQDIKVQIVRLHDNVVMMQNDIELATEYLTHLQRNSVEHDKIITDMRNERDTFANKIEVVDKENARLKAQVDLVTSNIKDLKAKTQERTDDCIDIHFRTRSVEKQIMAMEEAMKLTKNLNEEATQTIVGYKAEGAKLRLVLDEAQRDIHFAKSEIQGISELMEMMKRRMCYKNDSTVATAEEFKSAQCQMSRSAMRFEEQADKLEKLHSELEKHVKRNYELKQQFDYVTHLKFEQITLESLLCKEQEIGGSLENEMDNPRNVHRWAVIKATDPEAWRNIQMTQYLRKKLDDLETEEKELAEEKNRLLKAIKTRNDRISNTKISDGPYALKRYTDTLARKDAEMKAMKEEIEKTRQEVAEAQTAVEALRMKVKSSLITASTIKRQKQQQFPAPTIPVLQIGGRTIERSRFGGGFNVASEKAQSSRMFITQQDVVADEGDVTPPPTSRSRSAFTSRPPSSRQANVVSARSRSNFRNVEEENNQLNVQAVPASARKQKQHKDNDSMTPTVHRSPTTARTTSRCAKTVKVKKTDDETSISSRAGKISRRPQTARRTKTDISFISPYFGPL